MTIGIDSVLAMEEGTRRTAALAAWFQGLYEREDERPVLVGGAAVELYTRGAYRTGDLDFVGRVPEPVKERLAEAGFQRRGRHWVHERGKLFIELPSASFDRAVRTDAIQFDDWTVIALSPEDILVDRLASWKFWNAAVDGVNAFLLWKDRGEEMKMDHLVKRLREESLMDSFESLRDMSRRNPAIEEVEQWARRNG